LSIRATVRLWRKTLIHRRDVNQVPLKDDKGKDKVIPLQAWTGPEGSRRLRFPDFKTIGT